MQRRNDDVKQAQLEDLLRKYIPASDPVGCHKLPAQIRKANFLLGRVYQL
jgi:hypothetical protein